MTWRRAALLPMLLAFWACVDGGTRGSGISTSVFGNVVSIQPAMTEPVTTDLSGIVVTIEETDIADHTDADGTFSLEGAFDGRVTVVFALPEGAGEARMEVNVPAGGTLTLNNVDVDAQRGEAVAETADVEFTGVITEADCVLGTLALTSSEEESGAVDEYVVHLDTSTLEDSHGNPLPCSAVQAGQRASVQGMANRDGTFGQATIVVQD